MQASVKGIRHEVKHQVGGLHIQGGTIHQNRTHSDTHFAVAQFILFPFHPKNHKQEMAVLLIISHNNQIHTKCFSFFNFSCDPKISEVPTSLSSPQTHTSVYFNYGELLDFHIRWKSPRYLVSWVSNLSITTVKVLWVQEIYATPCTFTASHLWPFFVLKGMIWYFLTWRGIPCQTYWLQQLWGKTLKEYDSHLQN